MPQENSLINKGRFSVKNLMVTNHVEGDASLQIRPSIDQNNQNRKIKMSSVTRGPYLSSNNQLEESNLHIDSKDFLLTSTVNSESDKKIIEFENSNHLLTLNSKDIITNGNETVNINSDKINLNSNTLLSLLSKKKCNIEGTDNNFSLIPDQNPGCVLQDINDSTGAAIYLRANSNNSEGPDGDGDGNIFAKCKDFSVTGDIICDTVKALNRFRVESADLSDSSGNSDITNEFDISGNLLKTGGSAITLVAHSSNCNKDGKGNVIAKCGKFTVTGDLVVEGETTSLNTETTILEDINIQLGVSTKEVEMIDITNTSDNLGNQLTKLKVNSSQFMGDIHAGEYVTIQGSHVTHNDEKLDDIYLQVEEVIGNDIILDVTDKLNNNEVLSLKNEIEHLPTDNSIKPYVSKLKTRDQVNEAGLDIEFLETFGNTPSKIKKYIRYQSKPAQHNGNNMPINTWNVNAPIRMIPEGEDEVSHRPITLGKRPDDSIEKGKRGWSIVATDYNLIIRNEDAYDSNGSLGQIAFTCVSNII